MCKCEFPKSTWLGWGYTYIGDTSLQAWWKVHIRGLEWDRFHDAWRVWIPGLPQWGETQLTCGALI